MEARDKLLAFFREIATNAEFDEGMHWADDPKYAEEVFNEALWQYDNSIARRLLDAQADLQTALGILRLEISQLPDHGIAQHNLGYSEIRLTTSLAKIHAVMADLGTIMMRFESAPADN